MYKALNAEDKSEVVILDSKWSGSLDQLRALGHKDLLVCQGCMQPVRVRAGEQRRQHFAHKHLKNCPYEDESTTLLACRAVLYKWLVSKFGENVSIEKKVDGADILRPIDCWVKKGSNIFAYWIFDSAINPEKRNSLQRIARKLGVHFHWIFDSSLLKTKKEYPEDLILSTTEREFIQESKYDTAYLGEVFGVGGTLHYLDSKNKELTTFRGVSLHHAPQIYKGHKLTNEMDKVLVSPNTGEFVHNGEHEKIKEIGNPNLALAKVARKQMGKPFSHREKATAITSPQQPQTEGLLKIIAKCTFCGNMTEDWWSYDGKTGNCKCNSCLKQSQVTPK